MEALSALLWRKFAVLTRKTHEMFPNHTTLGKSENETIDDNLDLCLRKITRLDLQPFCEPAFLAPHRTPKTAGNRAYEIA